MRAYRLILSVSALLAIAATAGAQAPASSSTLLTQVSSKSTSFADEDAFPKSAGAPKVDKAANRITLSGTASSLTVLAGPEDDMMSFNIEGLTNPELVLPRGSKVTFTVINIDEDMLHSFKVTTMAPPYASVVSLGGGAVGTTSMNPHTEKKPFSATELVVQASTAGQGFYLCSVKDHAKDGMFGKLTISQ